MHDSVKMKLLILFISAVIAGLSVILYFADASFAWGWEKITSCVLINFWLFFIAPALRGSYIRNRDKSAAEWFKTGVAIGASRIFLPIILAPYYGLKYYFKWFSL